MKGVYLLIASLLFFGCEKKSEYSVKDGIVTILPTNVGAESAEVIPWTVGILGKVKVAKGINIKVAFPQLEKEAIEDLVKNRGVNSWLIRVRRRHFGRSEILGFLYVPIALPGANDSSVRVKQTKGGFFSVYYAAAALSSRFEKFDCPAFDHNLWIDDIEVYNDKSAGNMIATSPSEMEIISAKVEAFSYSPITLNGGKSLTGEYVIDLALYNHQSKRKVSNYLELDQKIKVSTELPVHIEGCAGFKIPQREEDSSKKFKFGR
ncbi:MAG: hypothetical protein Fur0010_21880 [Bdellovibrio sp.]